MANETNRWWPSLIEWAAYQAGTEEPDMASEQEIVDLLRRTFALLSVLEERGFDPDRHKLCVTIEMWNDLWEPVKADARRLLRQRLPSGDFDGK